MAGKSSGKQRSAAVDAAAGRQRSRSLEAISGFVADDKGGGFHKLLNDRVRLGILSSLAVSERLSFSELKKLLDAGTNGVLGEVNASLRNPPMPVAIGAAADLRTDASADMPWAT